MDPSSLKNSQQFIDKLDKEFNKLFPEKRYLVYKSWNGLIQSSIEYGDHTTGEGKKKPVDEIKRIELNDFDCDDLEVLKREYPLEKVEP